MDLLGNYSGDSSPSQSQIVDNKHDTCVHTGSISAKAFAAEWSSFETSVGMAMVSSDKDSAKDEALKKTVVDNDKPPGISPQRPSARRSSSASSDRSKVRDRQSSTSSSRSPSPTQKTNKAKTTEKVIDSSSDSDDEDTVKKAVEKKSVSRSRSKSRERNKSKTKQLPKTKSRSRERSKSKRKRGSKSRSRSRSHSKTKHRRRSRSRSRDKRKRSRSKSPHRRRSPKRRRSRSRERKDSKRCDKSRNRRRSREKKSRSRSRDRHRRRRSQSKDRRRRHHSRSRSKERRRSRSHSRDRRRNQQRPKGFKYQKSDGGPKKPMTFKDALRAELLKAANDKKVEASQEKKDLEGPNEKPSNLPLNSTNMFTSGIASFPSGGQMTPQLALLQTMAAMHQKAQEMTGVAVPKYYNPAAVNPLKYAEQIQKRKLLWSATKEDKDVHEMEKQWQGSMFSGDQDGKVTDKFRKLMGIKQSTAEPSTSQQGDDDSVEQKQKEQQEYFQRLDRDYEFARMTTHTHRGVGLGFTSQGMPGPQFPPT